MIETKFNVEYGQQKLILHETEVPEAETRLAFSLLERWGMVSATPDGEDSAGRSKLRLSTPTELIDRAFSVANLAYSHARKNNLIHDCGSIPEIPHKK